MSLQRKKQVFEGPLHLDGGGLSLLDAYLAFSLLALQSITVLTCFAWERLSTHRVFSLRLWTKGTQMQVCGLVVATAKTLQDMLATGINWPLNYWPVLKVWQRLWIIILQYHPFFLPLQNIYSWVLAGHVSTYNNEEYISRPLLQLRWSCD